MTEGEATIPVRVVGLSGKPGQGPHMIFVLRVANDRITEARYLTYGCTVAQICAQWVCDEIEGKTLDFAAALDERSLVQHVGGMPLAREHCPALAISALKHALGQMPKPLQSEEE